jgi:AraC-like DNA-binding protein
MAEAYLRSLGPPANDSLAAEVYNMVRVLIGSSDVTSGQTARALGMHERTLQRRLREEGASFEKIKDDVRRAIAEKMLADLQMPLTEIAQVLHYASPAAFTRSCRRWFGDAPRMLRRKLAQRDGGMSWRAGAGSVAD